MADEGAIIDIDGIARLAKELEKADSATNKLHADFTKMGKQMKEYFRSLTPSAQQRLLQSNPWMTATGPGYVLQGQKYLAQAATISRSLGGFGDMIWPGAYDPSRFGRYTGPLWGAKTPPMPAELQDIIFKKQRAEFKASMQAPAPPSVPNFRLAGIAGIASLFSPWVGARMMNQAFPPGTISGPLASIFGGGAGGSGGALIKSVFGAGGMGGFGSWFLLLTTSVRLLTVAFHDLINSVRSAAKMYLLAGRSGLGLGPTTKLATIFQAMGLDPGLAASVMPSAQIRGGRFTARDVIASSAGSLGAANWQTLHNLQLEFNYLQKKLEGVNMVLSETTPSLNRLRLHWNVASEQFSALGASIMHLLQPAISSVVIFLGRFAEALARIIAFIMGRQDTIVYQPHGKSGPQHPYYTKDAYEAYKAGLTGWERFKANWNTVPTLKSTLPSGANVIGAPGELAFAQGHGARQSASAWERMGLLIHGGLGGTDYAKQTAQNTKQMVNIMTRNTNYMNPSGPWYPNYNHP
jgi:hypothetical protein